MFHGREFSYNLMNSTLLVQEFLSPTDKILQYAKNCFENPENTKDNAPVDAPGIFAFGSTTRLRCDAPLDDKGHLFSDN